jgi:hypothetical protein
MENAGFEEDSPVQDRFPTEREASYLVSTWMIRISG